MCLKYSGGRYYCSFAVSRLRRSALAWPGFAFPAWGFWFSQAFVQKKKKRCEEEKAQGQQDKQGEELPKNEAINKNNVPRKKVETEKERGGTPPPEVLIDIITGTLML